MWYGGSPPLTGGRTDNLLARATGRAFGLRWVGQRFRARPSASLGGNPGWRSDFVAQQFADTPDVIRELGSHGRSTSSDAVAFARW